MASLALGAQEDLETVFRDAPLKDVLSFVEKKYKVRFSYAESNVDSTIINISLEEKELKEVLEELFDQTRLNYQFVDDKSITLQKINDRQKLIFELCGTVLDKTNNQALSLANVWLTGTTEGIGTDDNGQFVFEAALSPADSVEVSYLGYNSLKIQALKLVGTCPDLHLSPNQHLVSDVTITEYLADGIEQMDGGNTIRIEPQRLDKVPGLVEADIFRSIQLLPGIISPDESASGLFIRGGTPDQNLVLWDGIPVYHTGHLFGMISAFNPFYVESVDVYRSSIRSEYGGRASGVVDIRSSEKIAEDFALDLGVNLTHGTVNMRIPLWKKSSLGLSLRRSFTDFAPTFTFRRYAEKVFQGTKINFDQPIPGLGLADTRDKFFFSDFNLNWQWNPGRDVFAIHAFSGSNELDYNSQINDFIFSEDLLDLNSGGGNISWRRQWNPRLATHMKIYNSEYTSEYALNLSLFTDIDNVLYKARQDNKVVDNGGEMSLDWDPLEGHKVRLGYQYSNHEINLDIRNEGENETAVEERLFESKLHSLFAEHTLDVSELITVNTGLRYQYQQILQSNHFEPRIAVTTSINEDLSLKISSSKQFQFVSQLVLLDLNDTGISNTIWIASDQAGIPVIESNQWTGGVLFAKDGWTLDVEGYVKEISGITTLSNGFGNLPEQPFSTGNSRIRGIDILAKKKKDNWRAWLSYTFSDADYEFRQLSQSAFPASHDLPHNLQIVYMRDAHPWEFSVGWNLRSGLPWTQPIDLVNTTNNQGQPTRYIEYGPQNGERLPSYHRLDASVLFHLPPSEGSPIETQLGLSFINLYDRNNSLGKDFFIDDHDSGDPLEWEIIEVEKTGLRFLPNVSVRMSW